MSKNIKLVIGSTRQNRVGKSIASWIEDKLANNSTITLETIDLKEENLPIMDSPIPPAYAAVDTEAAKAWSRKIRTADGFIFLTPEYNRSIPASLKNALDYLVTEWKDKPAIIVSYGYIDGGKNATSHLQDVLDWLKVRHGKVSVAIKLQQDMFNEAGAFVDIDLSLSNYSEDLMEALKQLTADKEPELSVAIH